MNKQNKILISIIAITYFTTVMIIAIKMSSDKGNDDDDDEHTEKLQESKIE